jgi:DNA helicase HerA-like ATPase
MKETHCILELISMIIDGVRSAVQSRPEPGCLVRLLGPAAIQAHIGATGDIALGRLIGQTDVGISIDSSTLSRHVGIFGTTGSGKSNCLQVIAEEASRAKQSVLIFDIEGEYVRMNEPSDELQSLLTEFGDKPEGVKDLKVYVPAQNASLNPDAKKFGIPLSEIDLEIFSEVLGLSPFERVYLFEVAKKTRDRSGNFQAFDINALVGTLRNRIEAHVESSTLPETVAEAHMGLYTKLNLAQRAGIIDSNYEHLPSENICFPGRISVIDLNESSDMVRNICIAHFLKEVFRYKTIQQNTPPIIIFAEEIHTFISIAKRKRMLATLTMLTEMARQGRKRGISLGLVSQQPALVPAELIELCNTRLIHRVSSTPNIEVLRQSTGNVPDSLWSVLLSLGRGQALVSSPAYDHAVIAQIRPNRSRRLRVDRSKGTNLSNNQSKYRSQVNQPGA